MRKHWTAPWLALVLVSSTCVLAAPAGATASAEPDGPLPAALFTLAGPVHATPAGPARTIEVDEALLVAGETVTTRLRFSEGEARTAVLRPVPEVAGGYLHWSGDLLGEADSLVTVIRQGPRVSALVSSPHGTYTIATADAGVQTLTHVSQEMSDADLVIEPPVPVPTPSAASPGSASPAGPDAAASAGAAGPVDPTGASDSASSPAPAAVPQVDVLVAYTSGAAEQAGGVGALESLAALSVAVSNDAFVASEVALAYALAGTTESDGTSDSASSETLYSLQAVDDGSFDDVHAARDELGADLVSLFVSDGGSYCGIAFYPAGAEYGFSVVAQSCAVGNLSFPHELGHNLGASHDRYVEPDAFYPDGHGYINLPDRWRTIMAYNDECADAGLYCTRIARFSNPDILYKGDPTGVPAGEPDSADNKTAINAGAESVAAYRPSTQTQYALTVATSGAGRGSVKSSPAGIVCGKTCSTAFPLGTTVTLTAKPKPGSTFTGWSGDCVGYGPCVVTMDAALTATANFVLLPSTTYQESAAALDGWVVYSDDDGGYRASTAPGDTAEFAFAGSQVTWLTRKGPARGQAEVTLDGESQGVFDLYAKRSRPYKVNFGDLESSPHVLSVEVLGTHNAVATGDEVAVNGFRAGGTMYQENAPAVSYGATWERFDNRSASGRTYRSSDDAGHSSSLTFTGTSVDWVTAVGPAAGKARVYIDGRSRGVVNLYAEVARYRQERSYARLAAGAHEIVVKVLGKKDPASSSAEVVVDAFVVR